MANESDMQLKRQFLRLLEDIDPDICNQPELAQEFARRLVLFTEGWAKDSENIEKYELELEEWIKLQSASTAEVYPQSSNNGALGASTPLAGTAEEAEE